MYLHDNKNKMPAMMSLTLLGLLMLLEGKFSLLEPKFYSSEAIIAPLM